VIIFIDSNIPMYVAGREHAHREPSRRFLEAVRRNEIEACTSTEVLQEILYRYTALGRLDLAREVYDLFYYDLSHGFRCQAHGYEPRS
jgi:predicted nucleic acid-binding protein